MSNKFGPLKLHELIQNIDVLVDSGADLDSDVYFSNGMISIEFNSDVNQKRYAFILFQSGKTSIIPSLNCHFTDNEDTKLY